MWVYRVIYCLKAGGEFSAWMAVGGRGSVVRVLGVIPWWLPRFFSSSKLYGVDGMKTSVVSSTFRPLSPQRFMCMPVGS